MSILKMKPIPKEELSGFLQGVDGEKYDLKITEKGKMVYIELQEKKKNL